MIRVKIGIKSGRLLIEAIGHAGYDEPGRDIVCAAISSIIQTAALGIQAVAEQYPDHVQIVEPDSATAALEQEAGARSLGEGK